MRCTCGILSSLPVTLAAACGCRQRCNICRSTGGPKPGRSGWGTVPAVKQTCEWLVELVSGGLAEHMLLVGDLDSWSSKLTCC